MVDYNFFEVSPTGRIQLGDLVKGIKYVDAQKNDDGTITLNPVNINGSGSKRASSAVLPEDEPIPGI